MAMTTPIWRSDPAQFTNDLFAWISDQGATRYDESVTQLEHALQSAALAVSERRADSEVAAALLHDVGHLLMDEHQERNDFLGEDLKHEIVGANWLSSFFPESITQPIRLHVLAKRYLCSLDKEYWSSLSNASKKSLERQGGPMEKSEIIEFEQQTGYEDAVRIRRYDDCAKVADREVPSLSEYSDLIRNLLRNPD